MAAPARSPAPVGVALLNLGGPWSGDLIEPFLRELFSDREIIRLGPFAWMQKFIANRIIAARLDEVRANYATIGGSSPQLRDTVAQARALERALFRRGVPARVLPAMRYAAPRAADAIRSFRRAGCTRAVALTLYPHYSMTTTGSSLNDLDRARAATPGAADLEWLPPIREYPAHPRYLDALAGLVRRARERVSAARRDEALLLFSAHGLPRKFIDEGDPYVDHIKATMAGVLERLALPNPAALSFQSRVGPMEWLKPDTDTVIREQAQAGCRAMVVIPVAFVSDHIETLYEIELLFGELARDCGVEEFIRVPAPGIDPQFIEALADLVEERAGDRSRA